MADATRIRRGLLSVTVLNFEDLTEDGVFGGAECEPPPRLQVSLISPELQRWTERGMVPKTIGPGSEAVLQSEGGTVQQLTVVAGVACVGSPLLHLECFSSPPPDEGVEDEEESEPPKPHEAQMCSELLSADELTDPQVHLWEQERLKDDLQRLVEERRVQLEEDPKDKALEGEIRQLEVDLDAPIPPPPALEKDVILLFDDGRQAARISVSLALALDPEITVLDDSSQGKGETPERTPQCPWPVEEAFAAAVSVLDAVISNAVDNWLDFVFQRRARQYAAAYCLEAACAVLKLADLLPVGEPQALAQRAHRKGAAASRDARPRSARLPADLSGAAARPPAQPRSVPLAPSIPLAGRPSPWSSPRVVSPRVARDPLPSDAHEEAELLLPYWGYVSEEAVPAPIDNMARGVVPIKVRRTGDMTDSILLEDMIPPAGIGKGKNTKKPATQSQPSSI